MRWLGIALLMLLAVQGLLPWLRRIGLPRLPGDFSWRAFGREIELPLATTLLLSWIVHLLLQLL